MAGQRYRGLLIGNASFPRDPHGLPALDGPLIDIEQLQQALTDDQVGLFSPDDLPTLPDWSVQDLRERVDEFFATATRKDILLLYYSGHGELDERNTLYLCARNTKTRNLPSTALSSTEINNMIDGSAAATTIIVLDCCHSGAFKGADLATPVTGRGRYVLTSSRATQLALDASKPRQPSPFTNLLVRGLLHADAQGHLTVAELYRQVHRWMAEESVLAPQLRIAGEGDVIIARRENRPLNTVQQPLARNAAPFGPQNDHPAAEANRLRTELTDKVGRLRELEQALGQLWQDGRGAGETSGRRHGLEQAVEQAQREVTETAVAWARMQQLTRVRDLLVTQLRLPIELAAARARQLPTSKQAHLPESARPPLTQAATTRPALVPGGQPVLAPKTKPIEGNAKPKKPTTGGATSKHVDQSETDSSKRNGKNIVGRLVGLLVVACIIAGIIFLPKLFSPTPPSDAPDLTSAHVGDCAATQDGKPIYVSAGQVEVNYKKVPCWYGSAAYRVLNIGAQNSNGPIMSEEAGRQVCQGVSGWDAGVAVEVRNSSETVTLIYCLGRK